MKYTLESIRTALQKPAALPTVLGLLVITGFCAAGVGSRPSGTAPADKSSITERLSSLAVRALAAAVTSPAQGKGEAAPLEDPASEAGMTITDKIGQRLVAAAELCKEGTLSEAEAKFQSLLEACEHYLGDNHEHTFTCHRMLGNCLGMQKRYADAEGSLRKALSIAEQPGDMTNEDVLEVRKVLVHTLQKQGKLGCAIYEQHILKASLEVKHGNESREALEADHLLDQLGDALMSHGRLTKSDLHNIANGIKRADSIRGKDASSDTPRRSEDLRHVDHNRQTATPPADAEPPGGQAAAGSDSRAGKASAEESAAVRRVEQLPWYVKGQQEAATRNEIAFYTRTAHLTEPCGIIGQNRDAAGNRIPNSWKSDVNGFTPMYPVPCWIIYVHRTLDVAPGQSADLRPIAEYVIAADGKLRELEDGLVIQLGKPVYTNMDVDGGAKPNGSGSGGGGSESAGNAALIQHHTEMAAKAERDAASAEADAQEADRGQRLTSASQFRAIAGGFRDDAARHRAEIARLSSNR